MVSPGTFFKASLNAGREFFRAPVEESDALPYRAPVMVPIRSIGPGHGERIERHLLALDSHDRYLRFGYAASDEQIRRYVASLNFERDEIFGIYNRRLELIAMAHLALSVDPNLTSCAEFGVSVLPHARGRGYGARLFERAVMHARNEGVSMMFIHALSENTAMLNIARKAGAVIERDGSDLGGPGVPARRHGDAIGEPVGGELALARVLAVRGPDPQSDSAGEDGD